MLCQFCSRKIEPLNPDNHVTIKTKHDRSIHLLHFNKEKKNNTELTNYEGESMFNDFFESDHFKKKNFEGFNALQSSDQDFSIVYKNKIKVPKAVDGDPLLFFIHGVGGIVLI